jgi:chromosome segregation ATPase
MIYNTNPKNKTGDVDPFNKKKLAEEAAKDEEIRKAVQRDQEKRKIQLQIDNLDTELTQTKSSLTTKTRLLADLKIKLDAAKEEISKLELQIKGQKDEVNNKNSNVLSEENKGASTESELNKIRVKIQTAEREKRLLEDKYSQDKINFDGFNRTVEAIKIELARKTAEVNSLRGDVRQEENEVSRKKLDRVRSVQDKKTEGNKTSQTLSLKKREDDEMKREEQRLIREIDKFKRELEKITTALRLKEELLVDIKSKIDQNRGLIAVLEKESSLLRGGLNEREEGNGLEARYIRDKKSLADLEIEIDKLNSKLAETIRNMALLKSKITEGESELINKRNDTEKLEELYRKLKTELGQKTNKVGEIAKNIQIEEGQIKGEDQKLSQRKTVIKQLSDVFTKINQEVINLNNELVSKGKKIEELKRKKALIR